MTVLTSFRLAIPSVFLAALGCAPTEPPTTSAEQRLKAIEEKLDRLTKSVQADTPRRIDAAVHERTVSLLKADEQRLQDIMETAEQEHMDFRQRKIPFSLNREPVAPLEKVLEFHRDQARLRARCSELKTRAAMISDLIETANDAASKEKAAKIAIRLLERQGVDIAAVQKSMPKETQDLSAEIVKCYLSKIDRDLKAAEEEIEKARETEKLVMKSYDDSLKRDAEDERLRSRILMSRELRDAAQKRLQEAQAQRSSEAPQKK